MRPACCPVLIKSCYSWACKAKDAILLNRFGFDATTFTNFEGSVMMFSGLKAFASHKCTPVLETAINKEEDGEDGAFLAVRVQELFGLARHPAILGGTVPLTLELLSPAHRPIQVTADLPGFWRGSWSDVRTEMRGRYPRHFWPEDPSTAAPTTKARPRGT